MISISPRRMLLGVALLGAVFSGALAQDNPARCSYVKMAEFPFESGNRPSLVVKINGKPARLLVDTGAAVTSLFQDFVQANGWPLSRARSSLFGIGGTTQMYTMMADSVELNQIKSTRVRMRVMENGAAVPDLDGLLGADFLHDYDLELDFAEKKLRFFQALEAASCEKKVLSYWDANASISPLLRGRVPQDKRSIVAVTLNGKKLDALIDTGASVTLLNKRVVQELGIVADADARKGKIGGIGKRQVEVYWQKFTRFVIGDEEIAQPVFAVADLWANTVADESRIAVAEAMQQEPDMVIGMDFLQNYRILVARSQKKLYLSFVPQPAK